MTTTIESWAPWLITGAAAMALVPWGLAWAWRKRRRSALRFLPKDWDLAPRLVFSAEERRVYRLLREAFPHQAVLCKLPLVRFCQPNDLTQVRYWYELLGAIHVAFAVCSANGRVLAAIDLSSDRSNSSRAVQIKQSVLSVCRVRYLRCALEDLPSAAELQLLVPPTMSSRAPQPAPMPQPDATAGSSQRDRGGLWQDSNFFRDSFFAPEPSTDSKAGALDPLPDTLEGAYETAHLDRGPAQQNSKFGQLSNPGVHLPRISKTGP